MFFTVSEKKIIVIYTYNLREEIIYQSSQRRISKLASVQIGVPVGEHLDQMGHQVITDYLKQWCLPIDDTNDEIRRGKSLAEGK